MSTPLPPPVPPTPGSSWKPSDIFYVVGSVWGFLTGIIFGISAIATAHPWLYAILPSATPLWFWVASYASAKGD